MSAPPSNGSWWREGVLYQVYPRSFADSKGDGVGDLRGILDRLDYLAWLGVAGIWLNPVTASPDRDWGYDVSDYRSVHPELGTIEDLDRLMAEAGRRDIRVLLDLVPNHTSDQHPWFVDSRSSRSSAHRDRYVWAARWGSGSGRRTRPRPVQDPHALERGRGRRLHPAGRSALAPVRTVPSERGGSAGRPRLRPQPVQGPDRASSDDGGSPVGELPAPAALPSWELGLAARRPARGRAKPLGGARRAGGARRREGARGDRSGSRRRAHRRRGASGPWEGVVLSLSVVPISGRGPRAACGPASPGATTGS